MASASDALREGVYATVGLIPVAGGFLGGLVNILWPRDNNDVWMQIADKVQLTLEGYVDRDSREKMDIDLDDYRKALTRYQNLPFGGTPNDKANLLDYLLNDTSTHEGQFKNARKPWVSAAFFSGMATIRLELQRERLMHYKQIYLTQDEPPSRYLAELEADITSYTQFAALLQMLCIRHSIDRVTWSNTGSEFTVTDPATKLDPTGMWSYTARGQEAQRSAQYAYDTRKAFLQNNVVSQLRDITSVSQLWPALVPDPPQVSVVTSASVSTGPFPSMIHPIPSAGVYFPTPWPPATFQTQLAHDRYRNTSDGGGIRIIKFWVGDERQPIGNIIYNQIITGMVVHYGGDGAAGESVAMGRQGGGKEYKIDLQPWEQSVIVGVRGAAGGVNTGAVQQLVFEVQRRKRNPDRYETEFVGNTEFDNLPLPQNSQKFSCRPPLDAYKVTEHVNAPDEMKYECGRLTALVGRHTTSRIQEIQFYWTCNEFKVASK